jgi:hypothetical protein
MADIVVTAARVARVFPRNDQAYSAVAGVAVTAGALVYFTTTGKLALSDASGAGTAIVHGMVMEDAAANQSVTLLVRGLVSGFTLSQAYGAALYLSDTNTGIMADTAGTVSVAVGKVWSMSDPSYGKVVYFAAPGL